MSVFVPGLPAGLTAPSLVAEPWKRAVANAMQTRWPHEYLDEACSVTLDFRLPPDRFRTTTLYNLLKATIDGLSHVIFKPSPSGHVGDWSREDYWITHLTATKGQSKDAPGVAIDVGPCVALAEPAGDLLFDLDLPGSPPLWPGDHAGQVKVLAWREKLSALLGNSRILLSGARLAVDLRFQIEPSRFATSDIDNFVVPAAQAIAYGLTDSFRGATQIDEIRATKEVASTGYCTRLRIFSRGHEDV
jgi:hypothetical protein